MKRSPIGSKLLSGYAILFAGLFPTAFAIVGLTHGIGLSLLANISMGVAVVYYGLRVFSGDHSAAKVFAILVAVHYLGITATNLWFANDFPPESRAAQMAAPRMVRGVLFAAIYAWYYLLRSKTADGFDASYADDPVAS